MQDKPDKQQQKKRLPVLLVHLASGGMKQQHQINSLGNMAYILTLK